MAERRVIKNFEEQTYPALKTQIDQATGFDVPVEVAWDSLAAEGYASLYEEALTKVYFRPLIEALQAITIDDMGKDAVKAGLKKVIIHNQSGMYGSTGFSFQGGVLTLDHEPATNIDDVKERKDAIQQLLENAL